MKVDDWIRGPIHYKRSAPLLARQTRTMRLHSRQKNPIEDKQPTSPHRWNHIGNIGRGH